MARREEAAAVGVSPAVVAVSPAVVAEVLPSNQGNWADLYQIVVQHNYVRTSPLEEAAPFPMKDVDAVSCLIRTALPRVFSARMPISMYRHSAAEIFAGES